MNRGYNLNNAKVVGELDLIVRDSKGFTIVELMMAVVIIAILAAAVSPLYEKYMAKARAMEGPVALAQFYSAEREIYSELETYVACVFALGVETEDSGYFVTGFTPRVVNFGKNSSFVPNCLSSVTESRSPPTCPASSRERVCNRNTTPISTSDSIIAPPVMRIRGSSMCLPYPDFSGTRVSGQPCFTTLLTDSANAISTVTSKDSHFTACTLGCVSNSENYVRPTEYTIDEKKKITLIYQGW